MPRPKKQINYEEELMRIDAQITKWKNTIKELEEDRRALLEQREKEEVAQLFGLCRNAGMTIDDLASLVQKELENTNSSVSA